jgi:GGDEF domain-containing protein
MSQPPVNLPRLAFEDCLGILRGLVVLAWLGVAAAAGIELWIRLCSDLQWPRLGGFSFTYNAILFEFAANTAVLTALLVQRDWYERVPRESPHRLRWLLEVVLVWEGLHLFAAFHVTGSLHGPLLPFLPLVLAGALILLPGRYGWGFAAYLLAGHLAIFVLESKGMIHARGLLADAFSIDASATVAGLLALTGMLAAAIVLAVIVRCEMHPGEGKLSRSQRFDYTTGLFRRAFLDERINAELSRTRRQGGQMALLLLALEQRDFSKAEGDLQNATQRLLGLLRLESDTPARYAPNMLAVLLPAAGSEGLQTVIQRIADAFSNSDLAPHLRLGAAVTRGLGVDRLGLVGAAEAALQQARQGAPQIVTIGENA